MGTNNSCSRDVPQVTGTIVNHNVVRKPDGAVTFKVYSVHKDL